MILFFPTIQLLLLTFIQVQTTFADAVGDLQTKGRAALDAQLAKSTTCTSGKLMVRKEWGDLSSAERKAYIAAVQCLMTSPSKLPAGQFPGAHNRYEDFVVTHMQQTLNIHATYWDWGRWAANPEASPIFDGYEWEWAEDKS
ncbi:hypothetical protein CJF30_00010660 [Rutstroemia sp. NJR-2017a BBW]|nr:hypothetical protein CJF30_00010660 [Rutstroemia sp. NJR-2017a BBW]